MKLLKAPAPTLRADRFPGHPAVVVSSTGLHDKGGRRSAGLHHCVIDRPHDLPLSPTSSLAGVRGSADRWSGEAASVLKGAPCT